MQYTENPWPIEDEESPIPTEWEVTKIKDRRRSTNKEKYYSYSVNEFKSYVVWPDQKNIGLFIAKACISHNLLFQACKCLLADLEGAIELMDGEVPECYHLSVKEGKQAIAKAEEKIKIREIT